MAWSEAAASECPGSTDSRGTELSSQPSVPSSLFLNLRDFLGVHPRSPRSSAVTKPRDLQCPKRLKHGVTVSPGPSAHTQGSPKLRDPPRAYLSLGQFCPRAFRMASVMLQQPEAHRDCSLWHPLHIVMSPSSVICYERDKDSITGRDGGGGRATRCVFSPQISNQELNRGQILLLSTHKRVLGPPRES